MQNENLWAESLEENVFHWLIKTIKTGEIQEEDSMSKNVTFCASFWKKIAFQGQVKPE